MTSKGVPENLIDSKGFQGRFRGAQGRFRSTKESLLHFIGSQRCLSWFERYLKISWAFQENLGDTWKSRGRYRGTQGVPGDILLMVDPAGIKFVS